MQVHGHTDVKRAILLMLLGGMHKTTREVRLLPSGPWAKEATITTPESLPLRLGWAPELDTFRRLRTPCCNQCGTFTRL